ncbi:SDR family oxidoreductase (plasmid) [Deinococcus sp. KNUC1210]|uniref:SDR family oxidoreductase n=1 Tax=Deinococcus sp. KNUC1210 TaxID=2917691 RepID=UPI001EF0E7E9|nr:SDR family oxidoreductase [Deinococcus sp. KNUC1210]ULH14232.1 SDR family oxidoreductase [Deinococcus sp. KNUC1210]
MTLFDLTGRRALITGSSSGIGLELARGLAQHGADVVLNGRNADKLEAAVNALCGEGLNAVAAAFDVTQAAAVQAGVAAVLDTGPIDILVNNAGIQRRVSLLDLTLDVWDEVLKNNLTSALLVSKAVAPQMIARGGGKIICTLSLMSELGRRTTGPYTASKGGLKMLVKAMCAEWAEHNIQINGIGPGYFETEMTAPLVQDEQFSGWVRSRTPAGRWGQPAELAGAAVFLASGASNFVNGQIIYVDGGMMAVL